MMIPRLLQNHFSQTLTTLLITLLISACGAEENLSAATIPNTNISNNTDTSANNVAVITGIDSASLTEDLDSNINGMLAANGKLNITDSDAGEAALIAKTVNGNYGIFYTVFTGLWYYVADNNQAVIQNLASGATLTDSLIVNSVDGTAHTIVITIKGIDEPNNPALITGIDRASVTEDVDPDADNLLEVGGKLNITDSNPGEAAFIAKTVNGNYGSLTINTTGNWRYAADNNQVIIQNLVNGAKLTDRLTVSSVDSSTHTVVITILGTDEANTPAVITGVDNGSVTEDIDPDGDNLLETGGKLNITDSDAGEAAFTAKTVNGNYGSLVIDTAGNWRYAADNNQVIIQNLVNGAKLTDRLTVSSVDSSTHTVVITILGTDEANTPAVITGVDNGSVTEDIDPDGDNLLETGGKLNITDSDAGEAAFTAKTVNGNYGSLVIDTAGNWRYAADNNQVIIQNLVNGAKLTDRLTVSSVDSSTHTVVITILGTDEANTPAVITGVDNGSVTEDVDPDADNLLEVNGLLNITDSDTGEAAFIAKVVNGNYGSLTINTTGNWSYAANNSQTAIQNLATGATLTDSLIVNSVDGTAHTVAITILGADENKPSADITLSWVAPAEREDNSALSLSAIAGYKVYYGTTQGQYSDNIAINDGTAAGHTFTSLPAGTYYFVVTTIDTEGRESQYSSVVTITI